jgi:hypothetical protein
MSRNLQTLYDSIVSLLPFFGVVVAHNRRRDDEQSTWVRKMGRQIAVSIVTAIVIASASGFLSSQISIRLFANDIVHLKNDIDRVDADAKETRRTLQAQLDTERARVDRVLERRQ